MRPHRFLLLSILLVGTLAAQAADLGGSNLLVPISGRTTGSFGSQWQTDLVVTNLEPRPVSLVVTFYGPGDEHVFTTMPLEGRGTVVLDDVLWKTLGVSSGLGMIRVSSATAGARFTARAYVVNRGHGSGEYGQGVPALPVDALTGEHVLSGVAAGAGRRTNIGIANPWPVPATAILTLHGASGQTLGTLQRLIPAYEVLQINDVFSAFGVAPAGEASVRVTSQVSVYAYASIVRNDTGDAVFVPGTGIGVRLVSDVNTRCAEPAPLGVARPGQEPSEGWIVVMKQETTLDYVRNLPVRHGFTISSLFETLPGFHATLTPGQIAALRCDGAVQFIEQNVIVPVP